MRALVVKDLDKFIEAGLLLQEIRGRRFGGFFFQSEMHALMTPVLLRRTGLNSFDADSQAQPPDGQLAQVEQGMCGSEGHPIIAADVRGQAAFFKKPLKYRESVVFSGRGKGLTSE